MTDNAAAVVTVATVALVFAGSYAFSLWRHPERNCSRCKGAGRHFGAFWSRARRQCAACGGKGRTARLGTWLWERSGGQPSRYRSP